MASGQAPSKSAAQSGGRLPLTRSTTERDGLSTTNVLYFMVSLCAWSEDTRGSDSGARGCQKQQGSQVKSRAATTEELEGFTLAGGIDYSVDPLLETAPVLETVATTAAHLIPTL